MTGGAGFIGSHLSEALLDQGHEVRVVDCLTDYYDTDQKCDNLDRLRDRAEIIDADLRSDALARLVDGIDVVFHQAGQPGVRLSWADGFPAYESNNVLATQRLLEACRGTALRRFVFGRARRSTATPSGTPPSRTTFPSPGAPTA